jgi:hypothetical protein
MRDAERVVLGVVSDGGLPGRRVDVRETRMAAVLDEARQHSTLQARELLRLIPPKFSESGEDSVSPELLDGRYAYYLGLHRDGYLAVTLFPLIAGEELDDDVLIRRMKQCSDDDGLTLLRVGKLIVEQKHGQRVVSDKPVSKLCEGTGRAMGALLTVNFVGSRLAVPDLPAVVGGVAAR